MGEQKKIAKWSICNNCTNFKANGGECCGGDHYYPNECDSYDTGNEDTGPNFDWIKDDVERHEAEMNAEYDGQDWF